MQVSPPQKKAGRKHLMRKRNNLFARVFSFQDISNPLMDLTVTQDLGMYLILK
jgi:hypothetical protein